MGGGGSGWAGADQEGGAGPGGWGRVRVGRAHEGGWGRVRVGRADEGGWGRVRVGGVDQGGRGQVRVGRVDHKHCKAEKNGETRWGLLDPLGVSAGYGAGTRIDNPCDAPSNNAMVLVAVSSERRRAWSERRQYFLPVLIAHNF